MYYGTQRQLRHTLFAVPVRFGLPGGTVAAGDFYFRPFSIPCFFFAFIIIIYTDDVRYVHSSATTDAFHRHTLFNFVPMHDAAIFFVRCFR